MSAKIFLTPGAQGARSAASRPSTSWTATSSGTSPRTRTAPSSSCVDYMDNFGAGVQGERVLQLPLLPHHGAGPGPAARQRPEGDAARQVQGARRRPRLGHQRRLSGLRHRGDRRGLQHVRHPDDVRQGGAGRALARGRGPAPPRRRSSASSTSGSDQRRRPRPSLGSLQMAIVQTRGADQGLPRGSGRRRRRRGSGEPRGRVPGPPRARRAPARPRSCA